MHFVKMHGIANDYVYIDAYNAPEVQSHFSDEHGRRLIREMSHRHTGIGSDGVILVCRPSDEHASDAHVRMRMFNSDGSESEMCGNGVRCVAKFAHDRLGIRERPMRVETGRGVLSIEYVVDDEVLVDATVDMGEPILTLDRVPALASQLVFKGDTHTHGIRTPDRAWTATFVSMGNPHVVIFDDGEREFTSEAVKEFELHRIGPIIEYHPAFPKRTNVHIAAVHSRNEVTMRTWERGAGLTQACGTGACAVHVAGVLTGRLDRTSRLHLPGGDLVVQWDEATNHVFMTGGAQDVFEGDWPDY